MLAVSSNARLMQPTIKDLFARHSQRKHDSAAGPACARSGLGGSSGPAPACSAAAGREELSAAAELAEGEVARPLGECPGGAAAEAAQPSTVSSSSGELRSKKRARAYDYFLVRLPASLGKKRVEQQGHLLACLRPKDTLLTTSLRRCWTVRQPAVRARTW